MQMLTEILSRLGTSWSSLVLIVIATVGIFASTVFYTRILGLRSFSKMSSFDFAITVAVGSLVASVSLTSSSLLTGVVALGTLFATQGVISLLRRVAQFSRIVDNQPVLLMAGERMLSDNLLKAKVTEDDVRGKLREANVYNYHTLRAVVLETTGDISVIHGDNDLNLDIFQDVLDKDELQEHRDGGGVREQDEGTGERDDTGWDGQGPRTPLRPSPRRAFDALKTAGSPGQRPEWLAGKGSDSVGNEQHGSQ